MVDTRACPKGLTLREQLAWAVPLKHPAEMWQWPVSEQMKCAVQFEVEQSPEEIDKMRQQLVEKWIAVASELQSERVELLQRHGFADCKLRQRLHIPFVQYLVNEMSYADKALPAACIAGFPVVGLLPPCVVEASPVLPKGKWTTVEAFMGNRAAKKCRDMPVSETARVCRRLDVDLRKRPGAGSAGRVPAGDTAALGKGARCPENRCSGTSISRLEDPSS